MADCYEQIPYDIFNKISNDISTKSTQDIVKMINKCKNLKEKQLFMRRCLIAASVKSDMKYYDLINYILPRGNLMNLGNLSALANIRSNCSTDYLVVHVLPHVELVKLFIKYGAMANKVSINGKRPIQIAKEKGYVATYDFLLDFGFKL